MNTSTQAGASRPSRPPSSTWERAFDPDTARDGLAVLALLLSLSLKWCDGDFRTRGSTAGTLGDVLVVTLLSVAVVAVGWLWRLGLFRRAVSPRMIRRLRVLANVPYLVLVFYYLFRLLFQDRFVGLHWLGPAVTIGLAGAVLAAQPRRAELDPAGTSRDRRWALLPLGIVGVFAVVTAVQSVTHFTETRSVRFIAASNYPAEGAWLHLAGSISGAGAVLIPAVVAVMVFRGSDLWRRTGVALGAGSAFLVLLSAVHMALVPNIVASHPEFSVMFWPVLGAAVSGPAVARFTERSGPAPENRLTVSNPVLVLTFLLSGTLAALSVLALVQIRVEDLNTGYSYYPDDWPLVLALAVLLAVAAVYVPWRAARSTPPSYVPGRVLAVGMFVLSWVVSADLFFEMLAGKGQGSISVYDAERMTTVFTWIFPAALLATLPFNRSATADAPGEAPEAQGEAPDAPGEAPDASPGSP